MCVWVCLSQLLSQEPTDEYNISYIDNSLYSYTLDYNEADPLTVNCVYKRKKATKKLFFVQKITC